MATAANQPDPGNTAGWLAQERIFRAFEQAWRRGERPAIEDYLPEGEHRGAVLPELARIDLESRLKAGEAVRAEDYLARFPELGRDGEAAVELVLVEYRQRQRAGAGPEPAEYLRRFPALASALRARLRPPSVAAAGDATRGLPRDAAAAAGAGPLPHIPSYEVLGELGRGGMGIVYQVRQSRPGRMVALKMISAAAGAGTDELARFCTEAEALARLQHPNIVQIHEVGEHQGQPYLVLELVDGESLARKLNGGPVPSGTAAQLVETLARAMHYAHGRGVVHRDLKPANVLLAEAGTPKITDFGLAKLLTGGANRTVSGAALGTPSYMAPEQAAGHVKQIGPTTHVYALGAILYELLTGRAPFRGSTPLETLAEVLREEPVPPRRLQPGVPRDLETICLKCLEKEPGRRYASALALADDLRRFQADEPIKARPIGRLGRVAKWARRKPLPAALVLLVALSLLGGTAVATFFAVWAWASEARAQVSAQKARASEGRAQASAEEAKASEARATENARRAAAKAAEAEQNARQAQDEKRTAVRRLYVADMRLTQRTWEAHQPARVTELLDAQSPEHTDGIDLRGFEWHYWRRQTHFERLCLDGYHGVALAYSADGSRLAAEYSVDRAVHILDADTGRVLVRLRPVSNGYACATAMSPDGRLVVVANDQAYLFDAATGRELRALGGHKLWPTVLTFSPDGSRLAPGSGIWNNPAQVGEVKVWDPATGKQLFEVKGLRCGVNGLAYSPDGRLLAAACGDGAVRLWDAATGAEQRILGPRNQSPMFRAPYEMRRVVFRADGKQLAALTSDHTVTLWDTSSWGPRVLCHGGGLAWPMGLAYSPDGKNVLTTGNGPTLHVWDAETGKHVLALRGHSGEIWYLSLRAGGREAATTASDGTLRIWDLERARRCADAQGEVQGEAFPAGPGCRTAFRPGTRRQFVTATADGVLRLWDPDRGAAARTIAQHGAAVTDVCFSPTGDRIVSLGADDVARVWDVESGKPLCVFCGHQKAVPGADPWAVPQRVAFAPAGDRVATAGQDGTARVWDAVTGAERLVLPGHAGGCGGVAFSPDGQRLATFGKYPTVLVHVWDAATGKKQADLKGHTGQVWQVAFSPDGKRLASASEDATVRIWDVASAREELVLRGHAARVQSVAFSPDGTRVASASLWQGAEVKLWHLPTGGQEVLNLRPPSGDCERIAFSADGRCLLGSTADRAVLWDSEAPPG